MKIVVKRKFYKAAYTIGKLYIDGEYLCDTLEPPSYKTNCKQALEYIRKCKVLGFRAIPMGTYKVELKQSAKFGKLLPTLINVPAFKGVLIHTGNFPKDTRGCILPGWNRRRGMVCGSYSAMSILMHRLQMALAKKDTVSIEIM